MTWNRPSVSFHDNEFWFWKPDRVFMNFYSIIVIINSKLHMCRRFRFSKNFGDTFQADHVYPLWRHFSSSICLLKVNNINNKARGEVCSKLTVTIKTSERRHWRCPGVFIVNFEHILHYVLVFLLFTINMLLPAEFTYWPLNLYLILNSMMLSKKQ